MRNVFYGTVLTWKKVLLLAVGAALVTAAALLAPQINQTSIAYIGVTVDFWLVMELFIALNCLNPWEAGSKALVFFLVSQPLIYLFQVPFSEQGLDLLRYYPNWILWTIVCFPVGAVAWFIRKDNILSALILSLFTGYLAYAGAGYTMNCINRFPKELAAAVFCLLMAVVLIFSLLLNKWPRIIACVLTACAAGAMVCLSLLNGAPDTMQTMPLDASVAWTAVTESGDDVGTYEITTDNGEASLVIRATNYGTETVTVTDAAGEHTVTFTVTYDRQANSLTVAQ